MLDNSSDRFIPLLFVVVSDGESVIGRALARLAGHAIQKKLTQAK